MKTKFKAFMFAVALTIALNANAQYYSLGSNLIGDATGNINMELSASAGKNFTVHLPVIYNPFIYNFLSDNAKMQNLTAMPGIRYWFKENYMNTFIGLHAIGTRYHMGWKQWSKYRYDGYGVGGGLSIGYAKMIHKNWNLEFELAGSLMYTEYKRYKCESCGYYSGKFRKTVICPTKAAVSMIYLF